MLRTAFVIALSTLILAGCSGDSPGTTANANNSAASAPAASESVNCDEHYREVRDGILGALRGTEALSLVGLSTRYSEGNRDAPRDGALPASMNCKFDSKKLRRDRKPNSGVAWPLAPQCEALLQRLDSACLQPLIELGTPFSKACSGALLGVASVGGEQQQSMANDGLCESAASGL